MIEQPQQYRELIENLYQHLIAQEDLATYLTTYAGQPAIFNQEAPPDVDQLWAPGSQYGRIVFAVDLQGDPERTMGGTLAVDIMCKESEQFPEDVEPVLRPLIHGWFFSAGTFTVEAQWKNSAYFTEPTDKVTGVTVTFDLLGFPVMTTGTPDVIARINEWTGAIDGLHVINYDELPATAWKPTGTDSAVYWRLVNTRRCNWIPSTFSTVWYTATLRCHIFSEDHATADLVAHNLVIQLDTVKRLLKAGESPIMVNMGTDPIDSGANPLRTGQLTVEGTYGVIVYISPDKDLDDIHIGGSVEDNIGKETDNG